MERATRLEPGASGAMVPSLYLFPYGGGSAASYRSYIARYPVGAGTIAAVELPGRGRLAGEPAACSLPDCARRLIGQIDRPGSPLILHGHCMGALLAFEAVKAMTESGAPAPALLVVSGRNAPCHTNSWLHRVKDMDDRSLFEELQRTGAIPAGLSLAMAQGFLALLRDDETMFRGYDPGQAPIDVPILALAGRDDDMTSADGLADWAGFTRAGFALEWFEGRHYFFNDHVERIAARIAEFVECGAVEARPA